VLTMNSDTTMNEQISVFADGECAAAGQASLLKMLRDPAARQSWDAYHFIGDAIRSGDTAIAMSAEFSARMAARLDAEPTYLGADLPEPVLQSGPRTVMQHDGGMLRRFAIPAAAAAAILLSVAVAPKFIGVHSGAAGSIASLGANGALLVAAPASAKRDAAIMRDAGIDEYLQAHQRFSPSLYSTAQYAHPSTFATESAK
jgi:sigma-E factor negative regulatory protein RseA